MRAVRVPLTMPAAYVVTRSRPGGGEEAICVSHMPDADPGVVQLTADLDLPAISPARLSATQAREIGYALLAAADEAEETERRVFDL